MGADGAEVAADDRAGQRGVALLEGVVEGGGEQRAQGAGRVRGTGRREDLHGLGDQGDQVVGAVREARVVERAHLLGHPHRRAAEVGDERLDERALGRLGGEAEDRAGEPVEVDRRAGERHRRVHRGHPGADRAGRLEDGQAVPAGGVHDVLALVEGAAVGEHRDDVAEHVVGDGEQQQVAGAGHVGRLAARDPGQQLGHPAARGVGLARGGDDVVARRARSAALRTAPTRPAPTTPTRMRVI